MENILEIINAAIAPDSTPEQRRAAFLQALQARHDSDDAVAVVRALTESADIRSASLPVKSVPKKVEDS
jgi:hypothetical protein